MTVYQLQKDIGDEIEKILSDMVFKDPHGGMGHMKAFSQDLPKREQTVRPGEIMPDEEELEDPYPFCIIRAEEGEIYSGAQKVKILAVFGVFDDDLENLGHQALLNVINRVAERFMADPVLKDMYRMDSNEGIRWVLDDESVYPYFIGGMEMTWNAYFVEREDRYA